MARPAIQPVVQATLEIEPAGQAINVQQFAAEIESWTKPALDGLEIHFAQAHPAAGGKFLVVETPTRTLAGIGGSMEADSRAKKVAFGPLQEGGKWHYVYGCEQNSVSCRESPKGSYTHGFFLFGLGCGKRDCSVSGLAFVKKVPCGGPK
jgi:hypothetical protein